MNQLEFMAPRLEGERFHHHTLPLEVLRDFSALQEMLIAVAKWEFRRQHSDRQRVPRNFDAGLELHLSGIAQGSVIATLVLPLAGLFPHQNVEYLETARDHIVESIALVDAGQPPPLPPHLLSYFDHFGRSLRAGESITFRRSNGTDARLTLQSRHKLVMAARVESWTEEVALRGRISEVDQDRNSFQLQLRDDRKLIARLDEQFREIVFQAFNQYREGAQVLIKGVARTNSRTSPSFLSIETVERVSLIEPRDIGLRVEELAELRDGWLDGKGLAPPAEGLRWLEQAFHTHYSDELSLPYLYPTPEGGIRAEWSTNNWEISLDIDLTTRIAAFQAVHLPTDDMREIEWNLGDDEGWRALEQQLNATGDMQA